MKCRVFIQFAVSIALMGGFVACDSDDPKPEPGIEVKNDAQILGRVYDKTTFKPIAGAVVFVDNKEVARSIDDGVFTFASPEGKKVSLKVTASGYFSSTVEVDHAATDHAGSVAYTNIALMQEVSRMDVDPTKDTDISVLEKNSAPMMHVTFPANVLPSDVKSILVMNYVLPVPNNYAAFYMDPWGTALSTPTEVAFMNKLPASIYYDGMVVADNGSMDLSKADPMNVIFDAVENAYKFTINRFGNYVMNANIQFTEGPIVVENTPYQTLVIDNACGQNSVYEWKKCIKSVSGYEVKTNLETEIKNRFSGISGDDALLVRSEVIRMIETLKNSAVSKVEREVCSGTVTVNPGTINVFKSYLSTRTSTMSFNFRYNESLVKLDVSIVDYLGLKETNEAISCSDHSGGGTN